MTRFILASLSPRRRQLMRLLGFPYDVKSIPVDENSITNPDPARNCLETAQLKSHAVAAHLQQSNSARSIIVAADTIVAVDNHMLGKPQDAANAFEMLSVLRDRSHEVHTGVSIIDLETGGEIQSVHTAEVVMRPYSDREIKEYIATGDPLDKAGAYAIQDSKFKPVRQLNGCYLGVMGLSICHLLQLLTAAGLPINADERSLRLAHQEYPCPVFDKITQKQS
ncbi:MAG: Maf family protein [Candidatus Promineifilaceae bacterium]|nr:Maf family protein [Candidatus Promineifilaceae bacterium]